MPGGAPCHRVRKQAAEKLALLEAKLRDLQNWRRELRATLKVWDRRLSKTPRGKGSIAGNTRPPEEPDTISGSRHSQTGDTMKLILLLALSIASQSAQNPKPEECPMHAAHTQMNERGEKGMGFSQTATTHL
jgi:hypothetical protein